MERETASLIEKRKGRTTFVQPTHFNGDHEHKSDHT